MAMEITVRITDLCMISARLFGFAARYASGQIYELFFSG